MLIERSGRLGDTAALVVSPPDPVPTSLAEETGELRCLGEPGWGVIALEGADDSYLIQMAQELQSWSTAREGSAAELARRWLASHPRNEAAARAVTILFDSPGALQESSRSIPRFLDGAVGDLTGLGWELHRYSETPLGFSGDVTFIYPGSGSLFPAAGQI